MATLVSTGQITIIDTNDSKTITCVIASDLGTQQIYGKDNDTVSFTPSWFTANGNTGLTLTVQMAISGLTTAQSWASLTNKQFSLTAGGTALTTATASTNFVNDSDVVQGTPFTVTHGINGTTTVSTMKIKGNLKDTTPFFTVFFDADFVDPNTGLTTHIIAQITLNTLKTGTNAVYILIRGVDAIEQEIKSTTAISADLVRSSGIDTSNLSYKWYDSNGATQISTSTANYATKYGLKTVASGVPTSSDAERGLNIPASGSGNAFNTLVVHNSAVTDMAIFRVDITDTLESKTYSHHFTVYDISDPYDLKITSSNGDKLMQGKGNTTLTPSVYYGANKLPSLAGYVFIYYLYDKNGKRSGFVDTSKISLAGGATIISNGTGASATFGYSGTSYGFVAGDLVKAVKPNGDAYFYEVASSTTNSVTIRAPVTNTWLTFTDFPAPTASTDFVGGKFFGCMTQGTRTVSVSPWQITVGEDEIDVKGSIFVEALRP